MSTEQNKTIAQRFFKAQDQQKGPLAAELCAPNYTAHIAGIPPMNREGHNQFGLMFYAGFPDIYHTIDETVAEGDKVTVRCTLRGTHKGNFMGVPPTDKPLTTSFIAILRIADGKVTTLNAAFNALDVMQQIGAVPMPA